VVLLSGFVAATLFLPSMRVGDGSEYYAMFLAWTQAFRPWMLDFVWQAYERFAAHSGVAGVVSADRLANAFPALKIGDTHDFNHFWFYSFLAAIVGFVPQKLGLADPTISFGALHGLLLAVPAVMAYRSYGWVGVVAVLLLVLSSPLIWYINKVHTEFFTVTMVAASVLAIMRRDVPLSALFLAIASTQNLPIAGVAFVMCAVFVVSRIWIKTPREDVARIMLILTATAIFAALHPIYYYMRFHVLTPQLLAGGAEIGIGLRYAFIWLIDPDIGLLPNWPTGVVALIGGLLIVAKRPGLWDGSRMLFFAYSLLFIAVCLFAQSSTTNINSGATPGPARYGLWYIPLALPFIITCIRWASEQRVRLVMVVGLTTIACAVSSFTFAPWRHEAYNKPTLQSTLVQTYLPALYEPPPEIWLERYSGHGERRPTMPYAAVVGPDCNRVLVTAHAAGSIENVYHCRLRPKAQKAIRAAASSSSGPRYIWLRKT
jgi:hypothetical protein